MTSQEAEWRASSEWNRGWEKNNTVSGFIVTEQPDDINNQYEQEARSVFLSDKLKEKQEKKKRKNPLSRRSTSIYWGKGNWKDIILAKKSPKKSDPVKVGKDFEACSVSWGGNCQTFQRTESTMKFLFLFYSSPLEVHFITTFYTSVMSLKGHIQADTNSTNLHVTIKDEAISNILSFHI